MRILLATSRYPWPARRGNQLRALQFADWLAAQHDVTLLAPASAGATLIPGSNPFRVVLYRRRPWAPVLGLLRAFVAGRPLQGGLYEEPALHSLLRERAVDADLVLLQLVRFQGLLPACGATPVATDFVDDLALNFERRAALDARWKSPALRFEAARLRRAQHSMAGRSRCAWVVGERDRAHLVEGLEPSVASRVRVLPLGMPISTPAPTVAALAPRVVLTGNLGYFPTAEGASWLLREVWPRVRAAVPAATLVLAGARPSRGLRALAISTLGVELVAAPSDLAAVLAQGTVAVAPLRAGSGMPIKILEAWSAGLPVVASTYGAAGTTGVAGEDLLVADDAESFAAAIVRLLEDPALRSHMVRAARARLVRDYGVPRLQAQLLADVEEAVAV